MTTRRRFVAASALALGGGQWLTAQTALPALPALSNEGAGALWDEVLAVLTATYYEPLDEAEITTKCIDLLAAKVTGASRLKPPSYGTSFEERRYAFQEFILGLSTLAGKSAAFYVELAIELLCEQRLKFSHYLSATVVSALQQIGQAGLGMEVQVRGSERFFCVPEPGSAAEQKGIRIDDELISVDGVAVTGMNRFRLKPRLYGSEGSQVQISVRQKSGRILAASLTRRIYAGARATAQADPAGPRIRIPGTINANTVSDLRGLLKNVREQDLLTLDLRNNGGGEIQHAVDAVGLLVPGPRPLQVGIKKKREMPDTVLVTDQPPVSKARRIVILQNEGTASASELLIAALQGVAGLHVSVGGTRSFGKDLWQEQITVTNGGGQLTISVGSLARMDGTGWAEGIQPTFQT